MDPSSSYWNEIAPRWDTLLSEGSAFMNHQESFRRFHWFLKRAVKIGNRTKSYHLLDLGCGTGEASWPLWKRVASVTFLDRSPAMLKAARNKCQKGLFVQGDAGALPFLDAEFDVVISRGALFSQLEESRVDEALAHLWRVLRPHGLAYFDFLTDPALLPAPPGLYRRGWQRSEMETLLATQLPAMKILAYDGRQTHAVNRILIKKI